MNILCLPAWCWLLPYCTTCLTEEETGMATNATSTYYTATYLLCAPFIPSKRRREREERTEGGPARGRHCIEDRSRGKRKEDEAAAAAAGEKVDAADSWAGEGNCERGGETMGLRNPSICRLNLLTGKYWDRLKGRGWYST